MRLDPNPLFRKIIAPWYDGNLTCWMLLMAMVAIMLFSWAGIAASGRNPAYNSFAWIPYLLLALSFCVGVSVGYRLFRRYYDQHMQNKEL